MSYESNKSWHNPDANETTQPLEGDRLAALQEVALSLTSTLELEEVLRRVAELAQKRVGAAHAHIFSTIHCAMNSPSLRGTGRRSEPLHLRRLAARV